MNTSRIVCTLILIGTLLSVPATAQQQIVDRHAEPFEHVEQLALMLDEIGPERLVLLGESSHGTSEFYSWRAAISKWLIQEKGFQFIAVEGDWPAMARINEYIKQKENAPASLEAALATLDRWPLWMWRNEEVKELVEWLYEYNMDRAQEEKVGFYGIDLYGKRLGMEQVVQFLENRDPDGAEQAERAYSCLTRFDDVRNYIQMVAQFGDDCSQDMQQVLTSVQEMDGFDAAEWGWFTTKQNAKMVIRAEEHFRGNLERGAASWNTRATHFYETVQRLMAFYGDGSRGVVWAHNTHIGDARATDMQRQGAVNIGQLAREDLGREQVFAIGFGTYTGTVLAAREWEGTMQVMETPPARSDSWEAMLAATGHEQAFINLKRERVRDALRMPIQHRAIGVTFQPEMEAHNYVDTVLPERYDAFIFIRNTSTLQPLDL